MPEVLRSFGAFLWGIVRRCFLWLPSLLLDPFDYYNQYLKQILPEAYRINFRMPGEYFGLALGIGISVAGILAYHEVRKKNLEFEALLAPRLELAYVPTDPGCRSDEQARGAVTPTVTRSFYVRVKNISARTVENVQVKLEHYEPHGSSNLPEHLMLKNDRPRQWQFTRSIALHPSEVAYYWAARKPTQIDSQSVAGTLTLGMISMRPMLPPQKYIMTIVATGQDVATPCREHFAVDVDSRGFLTFRVARKDEGPPDNRLSLPLPSPRSRAARPLRVRFRT
jgi:hypothetical protein